MNANHNNNDDYSFASSDDLSTDILAQDTEAAESKKDAKLEILAQREQRGVLLLRMMTMGVLIAAAIAFCVVTFKFLSSDESSDYQNAFVDQSNKVVETFASRLEERMSAIDYFGLSIVSHSIGMNIEWPKLFLPHYEVRGNKTNTLGGTISVSVLPIVTGDTRIAYDMFSNMMQKWLPDGLAFQEWWADSSWTRPSDWNDQVGKIPPTIRYLASNGTKIDASGDGPFLPKWMSAPALTDTSIVSLDLLAHPAYKDVLSAGLESGRVLFGRTFEPSFGEEENRKHEILEMYFERWSKVGKDFKNDPVVDLVYPLYDDFFGEPNLVGLIHSHVDWMEYFVNLLPDGDGPLLATLANSCGQEYSFTIDGSEAHYLGSDLHVLDHSGPDFMNMAPFHKMVPVFEASERAQGECAYTLHVHPTDEMKSKYVTDQPLLFTLVIAAVFLFTSAIFISYDFLVERRQKKVMNKALQSGEIVSSLFPKAVLDRLYEKKDNKAEARGFNNDSSNTDKISADDDVLSSDPVADLYPECTVLFADVVGFTKWSSSRPPTEVFKLLETLYYNFDEAARRRSVFKVETVGDCYVAVTGLPNPQAKHAVIMTRFAMDCLKRMSIVIPELQAKLGADVGELSMRFGLHSGPVTAGVLRGEKGRFQLFGDTVNTAARMEQKGVPGRIHISEATAKVLENDGYAHWLVPREDAIEAKGKGVMQTFWIYSKSGAKSQAGFSTDSSHLSSDYSDSNHVQSSSPELDDLSDRLQSRFSGHHPRAAAVGDSIEKNIEVEDQMFL